MSMSGEILEREIFEQPEVVRQLIIEEQDNVMRLANVLRGSFQYVIIAARGTSDNAARYAQYLLGAHNQLPVGLATPSLFTLYGKPPNLDGALVIGISQSGRSPDIVAVVKEAKKQGRPTLAITNEANSLLAQSADHFLALHAEFEKAVAATKTYTASLTCLALLSASFAELPEYFKQLEQLPGFMEKTLSMTEEILPRVERYRYIEHCAVIGRGFNYSTAFEISLKVKELTRVVAEPYSSADFLHGPISMIHDGFPVLVIAPKGSVFEDMRSIIVRLSQLNSELLLISDEPSLMEYAHLPMPLPSGLPEWLTPMVAVLPGQLFSLALARARGLDPDNPIGLTKVTETW
jgi:glucosamine--fructose-6-phosphate aminotransferase (isomerizing)